MKNINLIIRIMFFMILISPSAYAFGFDNTKDYDEQTRTITITNTFGFGDTLAEIKLETPLINYVMKGKNRLVAEFTLDNKENYNNVFNDMKFYDKADGDKEIERTFTYKYKQNGKWFIFDSTKELPKGKIIIGVFTDVYFDDYVDWVPTLYDVEISEWAVWVSSFNQGLVSYYDFENETATSTNLIDVVRGKHNATLTAGANTNWMDGLIGGGFNCSGANEFQIADSVDFNLSEMSLSLWIRANKTNSRYIWDKFDGVGDRWLIVQSPTKLDSYFKIGGTNSVIQSESLPDYLEWNHVVMVYNATTRLLYMNGTEMANTDALTGEFNASSVIYICSEYTGGEPKFEGLIDEIGIWNRSLSSSEVLDLYNEGSGLAYLPSNVIITQNNPINSSNSTSGSVDFNCSAETIGVSVIQNISLYIDGVINYTETSDKLYKNINFSAKQSHLWSCKASDDLDDSSTSINRTLNIVNWVENSQTFNSQITGGSLQDFSINLTYDNVFYSGISVTLTYNNTNYTGSTTDTGSTRVYSRSLSAPTVSTQTNKSFFWVVSLSNSTGTTHFSSKINNQSVSPFLMDNCTTYTYTLMNLTMFDEETLLGVNGTILININIYTYGTTELVNSYNASFDYYFGSQSAVCIAELNQSYTMTYEIQHYVNDSYFRKYKNIQNMTINNQTLGQNISLYNLLKTSGETFNIVVVGNLLTENGNANLLVDTQRQYINLNEFKSIESSVTSSNGIAVSHLVQSDQVYNFIVSYNGEVLATFNNYRVKCQNEVTGQCTITLNLGTASGDATNFENFGGITQTFFLDNTNHILYHTFSSTDGEVHTVQSLVLKADNYGNTTICNNSLSGTSGTIQCSISAVFQNTTFFVQTFVDGEYVGSRMFSQGASIDWRGADTFIILLMFSSLVMLLVGHPITLIIGAVVGLFSPMILIYIAGGSFSSIIGALLFYLIGGIIAIIVISKKI